LLLIFVKSAFNLIALVETGLDLGKGERIDHKGGEVHPGVPVPVKGGGIMVAGIAVSHVPNDRGYESHNNSGPFS
jgi:hypothetical protein